MRIIAVRHGETLENARHILMGHRQGTLNRKGKLQARKLALKLKNAKIDAIFSSDLRRARDTTREIARYHKVPVFYMKALREQNYGIFQGRPLSELLAAQKGRPSTTAFKPRGGESLSEVKGRVKKLMGRISRKYKKRTVLISAHAGIIWSLISIYGNVPLSKSTRIKHKNAAIIVINAGEHAIRGPKGAERGAG